MSDPYEEIIHGERLLRLPLRPRHEDILARLHRRVAACLQSVPAARLLPARSPVQVTANTLLRPDLAVIATATGKLWFAAEVVSSDDHHADTVEKKGLYEELRLPRLWMVDPRYDNVEVYHGTPHGLALKQVLAGRELLAESLLNGFQYPVHELFAGGPDSDPGRFDF
ncbi:MAG: hypothetical protein RJA22_2754 [Verrucomicrobiota bacterium]|jgi:Uma2 family endonuclease